MIKKIRDRFLGSPGSARREIPVAPAAPRPLPEKRRRLEDRLDPEESHISAGSSFKGEISGRAGARIAGELLGNIRSEGLVRVEESGKVKGKIESPYVILEGELEGDIISARHVELRSRAKMRGNIKTALLAIADGSYFQGQIDMANPEDQPLKFTEKRNPDARSA
jgi:cytoskeletal protein CcmA (bactofilin family)